MSNILTVCTGNQIRSVILVTIMQDLFPDNEYRCRGTGPAVWNVGLDSRVARALEVMGFNPPPNHSSKKISKADVDWAQEIHYAQDNHKLLVNRQFPILCDTKQVVWDLSDPANTGLQEDYISCAKTIASRLGRC